jgi:hypothetical protein
VEVGVGAANGYFFRGLMSPIQSRSVTTIVRKILNHLPTRFLRERMLGPRQSLWLLLTIIQSGVNRIGVRPAKIVMLRDLTGAFGWQDAVPSTAAMCKALRKLTPVMLESVIRFGLAEISATAAPFWLVHQRRLVAIDGVRINARRGSILARWLGLPKQADGRKAHQPQALVVLARCVASGVTLDQEIVRHNGSERAATRRLVGRLALMGPILVVMDRGIPARDLIASLLEKNIDFVVRMSGGKSAWKELACRTTGPEKDALIDVKLPNRHGRWDSVKLRAILTLRVQPGRPRCNRKPQRMLLLTNLTGSFWKKDRIIAAYHRRWDIETQFREDKRLLGATKSHSTTKNGFTNELLALQIFRMIMALAGLLCSTGSALGIRLDDPMAKRLSTPQVIAMAWMLIKELLRRPVKLERLMEIIAREIDRDAGKRRPGRKFMRICQGVEGAWKGKKERGTK